MVKSPRKSPEYSHDREWQVILEDLRSQFRVFGEGLEDVRNRMGGVEIRLERLEFDVAEIKEDVRQIKSAFPRFIAQVSDHEKRLTLLEKTS